MASSAENLRGSRPNPYWRAIPMEHLRLHPDFTALPALPAHEAPPADPKLLAQLRQDSPQWKIAHKDRMTTRYVAASLGFFELHSAGWLNIPPSLRGHNAALRAYSGMVGMLDDPAPHFNVGTPRWLSTGGGRLANKLWRDARKDTEARNGGSVEEDGGAVSVRGASFPYQYSPRPYPLPAQAYTTLPERVRTVWGSTQEATTLLTAVNYFTALGAQVGEVGLLAFESELDRGRANAQLAEQYSQAADVCVSMPKIGASPDAILRWPDGRVEPIEAKNSCPFFIDRRRVTRNGRAIAKVNSDEPKEGLAPWFIPQLMWHMLSCGATCRSAVLITMTVSGADIYRVERDDELLSLMLLFVGQFYESFVKQHRPPPENFFHGSDLYQDLLRLTDESAASATVLARIRGGGVQRSPLHQNFFW